MGSKATSSTSWTAGGFRPLSSACPCQSTLAPIELKHSGRASSSSLSSPVSPTAAFAPYPYCFLRQLSPLFFKHHHALIKNVTKAGAYRFASAGGSGRGWVESLQEQA